MDFASADCTTLILERVAGDRPVVARRSSTRRLHHVDRGRRIEHLIDVADADTTNFSYSTGSASASVSGSRSSSARVGRLMKQRPDAAAPAAACALLRPGAGDKQDPSFRPIIPRVPVRPALP